MHGRLNRRYYDAKSQKKVENRIHSTVLRSSVWTNNLSRESLVCVKHRHSRTKKRVHNNSNQPLFLWCQAGSGHPQATSSLLCLPLGSFQCQRNSMQKQHSVMNSLPCLQLISWIHRAANIKSPSGSHRDKHFKKSSESQINQQKARRWYYLLSTHWLNRAVDRKPAFARW